METCPSAIPQHTLFEVKILNGETAENPTISAPSSATASAEITQLQDVCTKFKDCFPGAVELGKASPSTSENVEPSKQWIKYKVKVYGTSTKPLAFKQIRRKWCGEICNPGDLFWLESLESSSNSYQYKSKKQVHRIPSLSFSLGSFTDQSTFIEHYNTNSDRNYVEKQGITSSFEHDISKLTLTITLKRPYQTDGTKFRLEFQYKQFEDYILVDLNLNEKVQTIDLYIPLIRPPMVTKDAFDPKDSNFQRCVKFLGCSKEVLGNSSVLKLRCAYSDQEDRGPMELIARFGSQNRKIYFAAVQTTTPRNPSKVPAKPSLMDFQADYALECLLSRGFKVTDRVTDGFYETLQSSLDTHEAPQICRALYQLIAYIDSDRFCHLETKLQQLLYGTFKKNVEIEFEVPKHYAHVPRIIVTPTQDYLVQPELVSENRVIRQYGHEFAMRVAFRDEDFNKLMSFGDSLKDVLRTRVVDLLKNGLRICGRHFQFLACSNSQLRDHGAWLFAKRDDGVGVKEIRESLGQLDNIRCVATYVSRMGQCFSSTKESVKVSIPEGVLIKEIPDIEVKYENVKFECCGETRSGTYTFSDGVGQISEALAMKVAESLGLQSTPSAYQIRYGGCKGMLAIKKMPGGDWRDIVYYRKSMEKFKSEHKDLEICEYSKPNFLYLNRQCITLLSGLEVKDEAFIKLQDAMLMRLASMLLSEKVALDMIGRANVAGGMKTSYLRDSGIVVTREPFFRSMLLAIYKARLNDLIRKARIAIPQSYGRLMVGVLDETGKLGYGQVFIRYTKEIGGDGTKKELVTRKGPVMVTKNPCFHPGDMRKLEAVDIQSLNHLVDCIVFPAKGPRPHTDEISGSDLDGDKYFVTWYEPFLVPGKNVKPMDFAAPKKKELNRSVDVNDMIEFIAEYIKNDQLGIIANAHLVHADAEEKGIKSEKCVKLAHMHSDAVDFPKTGKCPSLTQDLRPEQYPDFMMKVDKPRYRSTKVLGKLFQKCKQLERARHFITDESITPSFSVDQDLILEGHQKYINSAIEKRDYYNTKLGSLMALYGLKNEGEVITGCLMKVSSRLSGKTDERFEVAQLIQASVASLRSKLKDDFYNEFGGQKKIDELFKSKKKYPDNILLKASAWYAATYMKMASSHAGGPEVSANQSRDEWSLSDTPLLSFPWVVARLLAYIKKSVLEKRSKKLKQSSDASKSRGPIASDTERENINRTAQKIHRIPSDTRETHELRDISEVITRQAENFFIKGGFQEKMVADLEMRQEDRDRVYDLLCRRSGKSLPPIPILGVSLTGLNIMDLQPLELYIHAGWKAKEKNQVHYLESLQLHSLKLNGLLSPIDQKDLKITITADPSKMRKTMYVFQHIHECPRMLQLLLVIMHWGRRRHLIGSGQESFMDVEDLAVLFIRFCEMKKHIEKLPDLNAQCKELLSGAGPIEAEENWKHTILEAESHSKNGFLDGTEPGLALIKFLEHYAIDSELDTLHISKIKCVKDPVNQEKILFPDLSAKQIQRFSDAALHGFHEIAQCRGLDSILKSVEQENKDVQESLTLPRCTWGTIRGAEDFVACGLSEVTGAKVSIRQGDRGDKTFLEVHGNYTTLSKCQEERKKLEKTLKGISVLKSTINGGCHFIFLGQSSDSDPVTVKQLGREFAVKLKSKSSRSGQDEKKLLVALTKQLGAFNKYYVTLLHGPRELEMTVEFGSIYITDAHAWIESGSTVERIENMLTQSSAADIRGNRGKRGPNNISSKVYFNESRTKADVFLEEDLRKSLAPLGKMFRLQTSEYYVVHIKNDKRTDVHLRMVYDKDLKFKRFQFKSFKWLAADLKTYRPPETTSRDIDFRFTMTSTRELEAERAQELSIYETFAKKEILSEVNGGVKISEEHQNLVDSVQLVKVDVYKVDCKGGQIFLDVKTTKEFNAKKPWESSALGLRGCVDSNDIDKAREITRNLLSASKIIGPLIQHNF